MKLLPSDSSSDLEGARKAASRLNRLGPVGGPRPTEAGRVSPAVYVKLGQSARGEASGPSLLDTPAPAAKEVLPPRPAPAPVPPRPPAPAAAQEAAAPATAKSPTPAPEPPAPVQVEAPAPRPRPADPGAAARPAAAAVDEPPRISSAQAEPSPSRPTIQPRAVPPPPAFEQEAPPQQPLASKRVKPAAFAPLEQHPPESEPEFEPGPALAPEHGETGPELEDEPALETAPPALEYPEAQASPAELLDPDAMFDSLASSSGGERGSAELQPEEPEDEILVEEPPAAPSQPDSVEAGLLAGADNDDDVELLAEAPGDEPGVPAPVFELEPNAFEPPPPPPPPAAPPAMPAAPPTLPAAPPIPPPPPVIAAPPPILQPEPFAEDVAEISFETSFEDEPAPAPLPPSASAAPGEMIFEVEDLGAEEVTDAAVIDVTDVDEVLPEEPALPASWDPYLEDGLFLTRSRSALLIDAEGRVMASKGDLSANAVDTVAGRLFPAIQQTPASAPFISLRLGRFFATAVRLPNRNLVVGFVSENPIREELVPLIQKEFGEAR